MIRVIAVADSKRFFFCAVYEQNSQGSIPYVPLLKAPYYIWLGKAKQSLAVNGN